MRVAATISVARILADWLPGSRDQPWTWNDEEMDLLARECLCCGRPGHYQLQMEAHFGAIGQMDEAVCLGNDGRVVDGHHRIVAAKRLGFALVPLESKAANGERWLRDHGPVDWTLRRFGDVPLPANV